MLDFGEDFVAGAAKCPAHERNREDAAAADGLEAVKARLEDFGRDVMAGAVNRPVQAVNGGLYLRGLIEQGPRKSLEPMCERLGGDAEYQTYIRE